MSRVVVENATKRYGATAALDDVSLRIEEGGFTALLGPSGSGKTTLLRAVAGFVSLDEGRITLDGEAIDATPPHARGLGMVFQAYALFPHLSVEGNIAFGLAVRGRPRREIRARVAEMVRLVQLEGFEKRKPRALSGGQQQRVAIARALAPDPRVLLLDEPLSALDRRLRQQMQIELRRIQREIGVTTIFVTHDQEEALSLADHIAILEEGRIVQEGPPRAVYERPRTVFTARFLGDANILGGGRRPHAIRPERITIEPPGYGRLQGKIAEIVFTGAMTTLLVDGEEGRLTVVTQAVDSRGLGIGDHVGLDWHDEDAIEVRP